MRGRIIVFTKPEIEAAKSLVRQAFEGYVPLAPLDGPVALRLVFYFPYRLNESAPLVRNRTLIAMDTRPDADNQTKLITDVMQEMGFYANDSRIARLHVEKWWSAMPGISVALARMNPHSCAVPDGLCPPCYQRGRAIPIRPASKCPVCATPTAGEPEVDLEFLDLDVDPEEFDPELLS